MNVGEDAKAEEYLKLAEEKDPFEYLYRKNFLTLFEKMRAFPARKDDRFVVRLPAREDTPYYPLLRDTLDWSAKLREERWDFQLEYPLYISVFDVQKDFAARTIGLPGFPALGACFGRVVTLDSPRALPPGQFGWRATLHHELAHCITLQLSNGRVPRWLTEGASVYEERKVSPIWNREMERAVVDAIASDEILRLDDINGAFRGPRVLFAYYQGGLMCEFIERDFGFPALREMVRLYGEDKHTPAVVRTALGVEPDEFDRRFLEYATAYVADLGVMPRPSDGKMARLKRHLRKEKEDGEAWILYSAGHAARGDKAAALAALANAKKTLPEDGRIPAIRGLLAMQDRAPEKAVKHAEQAIAKGTDLFEMRMALAQFYQQKEKDLAAAETHYRRAIELFPFQKGPSDPRLALAEMILEGGEERLDEHVQLLRDHTDMDEDDWQTRWRLATLYETRGQQDQQLIMLEQVRDVCPLPNGPFTRSMAVELHGRLGELYAGLTRHGDAEFAFRLAVGVARMDAGDRAEPALTGPDLSDLLVRHAEALRTLGREEDALAAVRDALREDPENDDAKDLERRMQQQ
jgi:tetratricopeptide (TPR) repeat protein